ncbi:hypothetical protein ACIG8S_04025 [[Kitasatospora] papulosa]|uniref:hypothetical protein n=1 Tax=[Kitasatospora] papulosa TaxID=1464011 RepID=UPI0037CFA2AE
MSLLNTAARRIARHRAATPAELRQENRLLLNRQAAADDFFALLMKDRDEVHNLWRHAEEKAADAEIVVVCQQGQIDELTAENLALKAKLANTAAVTVPEMERDTTAFEDQATEPIDARDLQARFVAGPVVDLHHSPQAADPTHIPAPAA